MATNQPKKQVEQLEAAVHLKLKQLSLLQKEHDQLRAKEHALLGAIHGLEGSLTAVKSMLAGAPAGSPRCSHPGSPAHSAASGDSSACHAAGLGFGLGGDAANSAHQQHPPSSATAWRDPAVVISRLDAHEGRVQSLLQRLGQHGRNTAGRANQLYTSQLLQRATADPARMQQYLALTLEERAHFASQASMRLGLLLSKAKEVVVPPGGSSSNAQLERIVDELTERFIVCGLWEPPTKYLDGLMIDLDTQQPQEYPEGWWRQVAQAIGLTPEQKAALKLTWGRVKLQAAQLTAELERLQKQQQWQHQQRLASNRQFESEMRQLPQLRAPGDALAMLQLRQQQLLLQLQQPQRQAAQQPPLQPQHQHQQRRGGLPPLPPLPRAGQPVAAAAAAAAAAAGAGGRASMSPPPPTHPLESELSADALESRLMQMWQLEWEAGTSAIGTGPGTTPARAAPSGLGAAQQLAAAAAAAAAPVGSGSGSGSGTLTEDLTALLLQVGSELLQSKAQNHQLQARLQALQGAPQDAWAGAPLGPHAVAGVLAGGAWPPPLQQPAAAAGCDTGGIVAAPRTPRAAAQMAAAASLVALEAGGPAAAAAAEGGAAVAAALFGAAAAAGHAGTGAGADSRCGRNSHGSSGAGSDLDEGAEVLLQSGGQLEVQLERRMHVVADRFKALYFCQAVHYVNVLTKRQLAALFVHAHPFAADFICLSEAFEALGW